MNFTIFSFLKYYYRPSNSTLPQVNTICPLTACDHSVIGWNKFVLVFLDGCTIELINLREKKRERDQLVINKQEITIK